MLKPEDNERLVRVGPGTPAGNLFRRYWQPALLSSELPENDGEPVRVRLLGEDLIAFRDSDGKVGLLDAFCPHRRAPLFFGRNENCGLRCVYHGWKFDRHGACVEMPTEAPDSKLKDRVRITSYPCTEKGGIVWTYMGPPEHRPPEPNYEWLRAPETHRFVSKTFESCNYLQALEGGLDTAHVSFLHNDNVSDKNWLPSQDGAPRLDVDVTDYGYCYVSTRKSRDEKKYIRVYQYIMPHQQMRGNVRGFGVAPPKYPKIDGHLWVPIDDVTTHVYNFMYSYDESSPIPLTYAKEYEAYAGRGDDDLIPGTFRLKQNQSNDYLIDRTLQKTVSFTGVKGINTQDFALQENMGPIVDRSKEFLGSTDKAIVAMRRLLLEAIRDVEEGRPPRGLNPVSHGKVRAHDSLLPADVDWRVELAEDMAPRW